MVLLSSSVSLGYSSSTENTCILLVIETGKYEGETAHWIYKVDFSLPDCDEQDSDAVLMLSLLFKPLLFSTELCSSRQYQAWKHQVLAEVVLK